MTSLIYRSIIGIPAIGADPHKTWLLPDKEGPPGYIWSKVTDARTFLFRFDDYDAPQVTKHFGITYWALKLLHALNRSQDIAGRHFHFAAHR